MENREFQTGQRVRDVLGPLLATLGPLLAFPALALLGTCPVSAQNQSTSQALNGQSRPLTSLVAQDTKSELARVVSRYSSDRRALMRRWDVANSSARNTRLRAFYEGVQEQLEAIADKGYEDLGVEGRIDWHLLRSRVRRELADLDLRTRQIEESSPLLPFAETLLQFQVDRRERNSPDPRATATTLEAVKKQIEEVQAALERGLKEAAKEKAAKAKNVQANATAGQAKRRRGARGEQPQATPSTSESEETGPALRPSRTLAHRSSKLTASLRATLKDWHGYLAGYDPLFSWWTKEPYAELDKALEDYETFLKEKVLGIKKDDDPPIIGDPIGEATLLEHLRSEWIAYSPSELIKMAEAELAWCEEELRKAAAEMGLGNDGLAALEKTKTLHVEPGRQPDLVRDLAYQSIEFVEDRNLLTVPELAKEVWRMRMMSPERQKINPFFLGGETITVSYPTDTMSHEEKLMSLRGNNEHFSRATVHHELIPGHHLQGFMTERYNSHRRAFGTPFWTEGWALYWELLLWDLGFPRGPEDKVGMLFWRMHRCSRIIWSLKFHLGEMTADEAVEFLVERIGHEKENALGEVRRSLEGSYSPLYQAGYLTGGWQFQALHRDLVGSGQRTDRDFHDEILARRANARRDGSRPTQ